MLGDIIKTTLLQNLKMDDNWIDLLASESQEKIRQKFINAKDDEEKIKILHDNHPDGINNIIPIKTLDEYLKIVRLVSTNNTWYRGESKKHEFLTSKFFRDVDENNISNLLLKEHEYFIEFRRRALSIIKNIEKNDFWSWYFLIQHYGGPTRLLDWSKNPVVALFMALDTKKDNDSDAIVYLLAPTVLSDFAFQEININDTNNSRILYPGEDDTNKWIDNIVSKSTNIPESPIALLPPHSDKRIISQQSCFTLFGTKKNGFFKDNMPITCPCCDRKIISKIMIDKDSRDTLLAQLKQIGISSESIYPGLEGLIKDMNYEYK